MSSHRQYEEMNPKNIKIESSWKKVLTEEFSKDYFQDLAYELDQEKENGHTIYPPTDKIFHAFDRTPFDKTKAVIIGQDPYHNPGQAMGLCFSVPKTVKRPPSLLNIYKEINRDLGYEIPSHGDISPWADEGVLLLNAMLTVRENDPGSHRKIGWQKFTDAVISKISQEKKNVVFILWGNFAKGKKALIDESQHLVLESGHPSPFAVKLFRENGHFSLSNEYLIKNGIDPIQWKLEDDSVEQLALNFSS